MKHLYRFHIFIDYMEFTKYDKADPMSKCMVFQFSGHALET